MLTACGDASPSTDAAVTTSLTDATGETTVGTLVFQPDPVSGEAVLIRQVALSADELTVEIATANLQPDDQVYAIGVRLAYDPTVLSFIGATRGEVWADAVTAHSGDTPGTVVLAVAHLHAFFMEPAPPTGELTVYRVTFAVTRVAPTRLTLVRQRSRDLVWPGASSDPQRTLCIAYLGGDLVVE